MSHSNLFPKLSICNLKFISIGHLVDIQSRSKNANIRSSFVQAGDDFRISGMTKKSCPEDYFVLCGGYFLLPSWDRMGSMLESLNNESHSFHSCRSYRYGFRSGCVIRQLDWLGTVGPLQHRFMNVMQFLMKKVSVICQHQNTFYIRSKLIKITLKATGVITRVQCSRVEAGSNPSLHLA